MRSSLTDRVQSRGVAIGNDINGKNTVDYSGRSIAFSDNLMLLLSNDAAVFSI